MVFSSCFGIVLDQLKLKRSRFWNKRFLCLNSTPNHVEKRKKWPYFSFIGGSVFYGKPCIHLTSPLIILSTFSCQRFYENTVSLWAPFFYRQITVEKQTMVIHLSCKMTVCNFELNNFKCLILILKYFYISYNEKNSSHGYWRWWCISKPDEESQNCVGNVKVIKSKPFIAMTAKFNSKNSAFIFKKFNYLWKFLQ